MNNLSPTQLDFDFSALEAGSLDLQVKTFLLPDADLRLFSGCFSAKEMILERLLSEIRWQQDYLRFYGKEVAVPRLTAWYGDSGKEYTYSHITMKPHPWTELLLMIKAKAEALSGAEYNSVLLNLYRSGDDGVSWHQDNEPELGDDPVIASVSFGATRIFQMKHLKRKEIPRVDIPLFDGSLLVMGGTTQRFWRHRIPKTQKQVSARVNLTFRYIRT
ncbi:MAG: alpha-ketoglutarate-dependent dioxygenase AlkB [Blastocatellia bacterium]|nr:alpha-ketoglutarate-dependent dioxygenase AlkB [Blastocatellia bacterium]